MAMVAYVVWAITKLVKLMKSSLNSNSFTDHWSKFFITVLIRLCNPHCWTEKYFISRFAVKFHLGSSAAALCPSSSTPSYGGNVNNYSAAATSSTEKSRRGRERLVSGLQPPCQSATDCASVSARSGRGVLTNRPFAFVRQFPTWQDRPTGTADREDRQ